MMCTNEWNENRDARQRRWLITYAVLYRVSLFCSVLFYERPMTRVIQIFNLHVRLRVGSYSIDVLFLSSNDKKKFEVFHVVGILFIY